MATLFCDYESGDDNYGGTSFALLASGTNGRIASTTFSSAMASFPNDGSLIDQYISIFNGTIYAVYKITAWVSSTSLSIVSIPNGSGLTDQAVDRQYYIGGRWKSTLNGASSLRISAGDTIRIKGSPSPTSLGIGALWTSRQFASSVSINAVSSATPIQITTTAAHGFTTGDTVVISAVAGLILANGTWEITVTGTTTFTLNTSVYTTGTYTSGGIALNRTSNVVYLDSALTQNIASTGQRSTAWTAANANVTTSLSTVTREHYYSDSISILAAFTTGLVAYFPTGTLNLSGYQQLSFSIYANSAAVAQGTFSLCLCSDVAGAVIVNTFSLPAIVVSSSWMPFTVDLGVNLGSNIQSIALYANIDPGAVVIQLCNIFACKASSSADSLTLTSLIGKNTTGQTFRAIQSINGRRVFLDQYPTIPVNSTTGNRGYYGTTENVTTYKRETIKNGPNANTNPVVQRANNSGTTSAAITYSGGWDRTNMSAQDTETWTDGVSFYGVGFDLNSNTNILLEKLAFAKFGNGVQASIGANSTFNIIAVNHCNNGFTITSSAPTGIVASIGHSVACNIGIVINGTSSPLSIVYGVDSCTTGIQTSADSYSSVTGENPATSYIANCISAAQINSSIGKISNLNFLLNTTANINSTTACRINLFNCNIVTVPGASEVTNGVARIYSHNHDQVAENHKIFMNFGLISSAVDQRHTASGISWKLQPLIASRAQNAPVSLSLATIACSANNLVTVKAWMFRDNAGLTMSLVCKGGQIAGVVSDVRSSVTAINAWEEETITFTPTEAGVVEITAEAWGGSTFSGWVDDMTISQA